MHHTAKKGERIKESSNEACLFHKYSLLRACCRKQAKRTLKNRHAGLHPHGGKRRVVMKSYILFQMLFGT